MWIPDILSMVRQAARAGLDGLRGYAARRALHAGFPASLRHPFRYEDLAALQPSRNDAYAFFDYNFHHALPSALVQHRRYFRRHKRGFGEDAFHAMWHVLFGHFRFQRVLEIGVYRGQTVTLWSLLSRELGYFCEVHALSPFAASEDSVTRYADLDYAKDLIRHCRHFDVAVPSICRTLSTSCEARRYISGRTWDMIYIDGNHDYEVARHDWELASQSVRVGGIIVLDDAALNTDYRPPIFATAGHPGPSRVASEIDIGKFLELPGAGHNRVFQRR